MRKLPHLTAVLAICATPAAAEPIYRDLPKTLNDCAAETVRAFAPLNAAINAYEKEEDGVITHEFEAEIKNSDGEQSLRIVIYPDKTDVGSIMITSREKNEAMNVFALAVMDRGNLQTDATMSIETEGPQAAKGYETVTGRVSSAIAALISCAPEPAR